MTTELSLLINRIGLILGFLSFWFVTPELLGEERLRLIHKKIKGSLFESSLVIFTLLVMAMVLFYILKTPFYILQFVLMLDLPQDARRSVAGNLGIITTAICPIFLMFIISKVIVSIRGSLFQILADSKQIRRNSLIFGAILFVIGFILQFAGTY